MLKNIKHSGLTGHFSIKKESGTPFLFVHGMWGGSWQFVYWMDYAVKKVSSYAFNLRGHCGSMPNVKLGKVSVADYVEDVKNILRKIGPAILVGHSMGGLISQIVACEEKELVRGLVLVASAPPNSVPLRGSVLWRMWRPAYVGAIICGFPLKLHFRDACVLMLNEIVAKETVFKCFVPESGTAVKEIAFGRIKVDFTEIKCPTMMIVGKKDNITTVNMQRDLRNQCNPDNYIEYPDFGHMIMMEPKLKGSIKQKDPIKDIVEFAHTLS